MARVLYRLGKSSYLHPWRVITIWVLVIIGVAVTVLQIQQPMKANFDMKGIESIDAQKLVADRLGSAGADAVGADDGSDTSTSRIAVETAQKPNFSDPAVLKDFNDSLNGLVGQAQIIGIVPGGASPDGTVAYADIAFSGVFDDRTGASVAAVTTVTDQLKAEGDNVAVSNLAFTAYQPIGPTEGIGVLVALVVMAVTFGSLLAAGMPVVTALVGVMVGVTGVVGLTALTDVDQSAITLATMLGLAVGIDYALFLLSRHRQQLSQGHEPAESAGRAVGTAGSAVLFAGTTVIIALLGLKLTGTSFMATMGYAGAIAVGVSVLVALTLMPALMGVLKGRLTPRGRALRIAHHTASGKNRWGALVTRHPLLTLAGAVVALVALAIPVLSVRFSLGGDGRANKDVENRQVYDILARGFGEGFHGPLLIAVDAKADPTQLGAAMTALQTVVSAMPNVGAATIPGAPAPAASGEPAAADPATDSATGDSATGDTAAGDSATGDAAAPAPDLGLLYVSPTTGPESQQTADLVANIRDARGAIEAKYNVDIKVTGTTAVAIDVAQSMADALPRFLLVVVTLAMLLLLVAFRSLLVPLTALIGFLFTVAATFGVTTAVFQWGWGLSLFGIDTAGPLMAFLPTIMIAVIFGLAMDYQVFITSGMREEYTHGTDAFHAVRLGFAHGARVVAAAALIMVSVFAAFIFSGEPIIAQIGFALGFGILIDALIVRMTVVPAVMGMLKSAAWWLPRWLDKILPRVDIEGASLDRKPTVHADEELVSAGAR